MTLSKRNSIWRKSLFILWTRT